jgi:beta-glucosidase/6-phospho-beta-glucosidase/beta-galactosidase
MQIPAPGHAPDQFIWATGIEDTFVPQTRPGHRALDEYQLVGHYDHWREDLALAREVGVRAIRWGVPWYRVEPLPGEFEWTWTDQVIPYLVEELKITPIVDLMHYGCPFWLRREFVSDEYPQAVAAYAKAFAERYRHLVSWYTPLNEPLVNALYCGRRGVWPPYLHGDAGYIRVMLQLARGIVSTVEAIRSVDPTSIMVHVEATGLSRAVREDLRALAIEDQRRGYLCYDLITGLVTHDHPLYTWLLRNGASPAVLTELARRKLAIDVMGLNFYPQWSTQAIDVSRHGRVVYRKVEKSGPGFSELIEDYHARYQAPIIITETSARGNHTVRSRWLDFSVGEVKRLRERGVPIVGYTWFPLFTMIDWRYRYGTAPVDAYRLDLGLYSFAEGVVGGVVPEGGERWRATPLLAQYQRMIASPESVGELAGAPSAGVAAEEG